MFIPFVIDNEPKGRFGFLRIRQTRNPSHPYKISLTPSAVTSTEAPVSFVSRFLGFDPGFLVFDTYIRIGMLCDLEGRFYELQFPRNLAGMRLQKDGIRSTIDLTGNAKLWTVFNNIEHNFAATRKQLYHLFAKWLKDAMLFYENMDWKWVQEGTYYGNAKQTRSIVAGGELKATLQNKLGERFQLVNARYSTKTCPRCNLATMKYPEMRNHNEDRIGTCSNCGGSADRDYVGAANHCLTGCERFVEDVEVQTQIKDLRTNFYRLSQNAAQPLNFIDLKKGALTVASEAP